MDMKLLRASEIATAIVWTGIFLSVTILLRGSSYFPEVMMVLTGGAVFFVVLLPIAWVGKDSERRIGRSNDLTYGSPK